MERQESIRKHVSDLLALERHVLEAVEHQRDDMETGSKPHRVADKITGALSQHVAALETMADQYGANTQATVKELATQLLGVAAGLIDRVRGSQPLSRNLRDTYVAMSMLAMAYTATHAYGMTIGEERIARVSQQHLKDITPLLVDISKVLPEVVVEEIAAESDFVTDQEIAPQAVANTQRAWSTDVTESA